MRVFCIFLLHFIALCDIIYVTLKVYFHGGYFFMAIVYQHDKRSGITYAYDSVSYYDKEKKHSRSKRTLIGRVDPDTGEIVPTDGRNKNRKPKDPQKEATARQLQKLTEENLQLKEQVSSLTKEVRRLRSLLEK